MHNAASSSPQSAKEFETSDFYLASFLRCSGYELLGPRREGRRCIFVFRDEVERAADVLAFRQGNATVPALRFVGAIRDMKALLYDG